MNILKAITKNPRGKENENREKLCSGLTAMLDGYRSYLREATRYCTIEDAATIMYKYLLELQEAKRANKAFALRYLNSIDKLVRAGIVNLPTEDNTEFSKEIPYNNLEKNMPSDFFFQSDKTRKELRANFKVFFNIEDKETFEVLRRYVTSVESDKPKKQTAKAAPKPDAPLNETNNSPQTEENSANIGSESPEKVENFGLREN